MLVVDAGPLINLGTLDLLQVLLAMDPDVVVPPAVWREVVEDGGGRPGAAAVAALADQLRRVAPLGVRPIEGLGAGETEVLAVALELEDATVVLDDGRARRAAREAGLHVVGTLGLLALAKQHGHLSEVRPHVVRLLETNWWFGRRLLDAFLEGQGEEMLGPE